MEKLMKERAQPLKEYRIFILIIFCFLLSVFSFFWQIVKVARMPQKGEFSVYIEAQSPACYVWLVAKDVRGRFSDNGFLMIEPSKTVWTS